MEKQKIVDRLDVYKNNKNDKLIENAKEKINNLNSNQVKFWKNIIDTPKIKEEIHNSDWPELKIDADNYNFGSEEFKKHIKFIDTLMRYSEIKNILDENMDNDNNINKNNFFPMLIQLSEYDEMRNVCLYIFNTIDNEYSISRKIIQILNSVLNCSFIKNLTEDCFNKKEGYFSFKIIEEMFKYINDLRFRIIEKNEIRYIYSEYATKYKANFKVRFPKFTGNDLIYLFVDIDINSELINNYLIRDIKLNKVCLESIKNIQLESQGDNFIDYLNMIVQIIFEEIKNKNNANKLTLLNEILKTEKDEKIKILCKLMINLYQKEELDILRKNYLFNLDDADIYKYIDDKTAIEKFKYSQYPSLIFFILEYKSNWSNLFITKYDDNTSITDTNECMPFWLLCLRYFSSIECIISKKSNYFSKKIDNYIKNRLKKDIKKGTVKRIRKNWLNFVCCNNKVVSYEPFYEKIKLF